MSTLAQSEYIEQQNTSYYKLVPDEEINYTNHNRYLKKGAGVITVTQVSPLYEVDKIEITDGNDSIAAVTQTSDNTYTFTIDEDYNKEAYIDVYFKSTLAKNIKDGTLTVSGKAANNCWVNSVVDDIRDLDDSTTLTTVDFSGVTGLTKFGVHDGNRSYNYSVFEDLTSLTSVTLPSGITEISSSAFKGCTSLTAITIPEGVTKIATETFYGCTALASVTLPSTLTEIGSSAFSGCTSLASITIPEGVTSLSGFSGCTSLASITLPSTLTGIGASAFYNCTSLTEVTIPEGVTSIESCTFCGCTSLTSVTIPKSVTKIVAHAFTDTPSSSAGIDSLTTVNYMGTEEEWKAIDISSYNGLPKNITYNYTGN